MGLLYVALVHHPVVNRKGDVVASAVTNLDLHDLARTARTYDLPGCFIVTPLQDQQGLVRELISHWCEGAGKKLHPDRAFALEVLRLEANVEDACRAIEAETGLKPQLWATSARPSASAMALTKARAQLATERRPVLLVFGTAWGLAPSLLGRADVLLEPIRGKRDYNHLSVRCAAAILIDRLLSGCGCE